MVEVEDDDYWELMLVLGLALGWTEKSAPQFHRRVKKLAEKLYDKNEKMYATQIAKTK